MPDLVQARKTLKARMQILGINAEHRCVKRFLERCGISNLRSARAEDLLELERQLGGLLDGKKDLSDDIAAVEAQLCRLGYAKRDLAVLLLCRSYGYERWEALDREGLLAISKELSRCASNVARLQVLILELLTLISTLVPEEQVQEITKKLDIGRF
ncbi:hypothetical protein GS597_01365 [Synechococcales cyanobacterium C]|uniref:Uncharacterized protein n=1 Tax=Petrachloros mirabilis ULC683 TaxID=2781853 RepID=A0A8K1ZW29_9CYAN|nr:hypothetical protein [Petrachloros mirabilis]NCJ05188.1 hypothetical protein [Petrachloros mirabilis ULC683]